MTVGILREPVGHAQVQGFVDRVPAVYEAADSSDGFHARSIRDVLLFPQLRPEEGREEAEEEGEVGSGRETAPR